MAPPMKRPAILGALSFFALHILFVTTPVLLSGATGETQGWLTFFADFPLVVGMLALGCLKGQSGYPIVVCVLGPFDVRSYRGTDRHRHRKDPWSQEASAE
jgi:hypothetical protein